MANIMSADIRQNFQVSTRQCNILVNKVDEENRRAKRQRVKSWFDIFHIFQDYILTFSLNC